MFARRSEDQFSGLKTKPILGPANFDLQRFVKFLRSAYGCNVYKVEEFGEGGLEKGGLLEGGLRSPLPGRGGGGGEG